jgi:hypothetical protein
MSYTTLYRVTGAGNIVSHEEYRNSYRGAMLIWTNLFPLAEKEFAQAKRIAHILGGDHGAPMPTSDEDARAVWALFRDPKVPREIRIVLGSTLDHVVLMHRDVPEFIKAVKVYGASYSSGHLLAMIDAMAKPPANTLAWCWNQTSVGETWSPPSGKARVNIFKHYDGIAWDLIAATNSFDSKKENPDAARDSTL